jgi:hypothetical protein
MRQAGAVVCGLALFACTESQPSGPPPVVSTAVVASAAATASAASVSSADPPRSAPDAEARCDDSADLALFSSPKVALAGGVLRVVAVAEKEGDGRLVVTGPDGAEIAATAERRGGPPYFWTVTIPSARAGSYRAKVTEGDRSACRAIEVAAEAPKIPHPRLWPIERAWGTATENLYSAWIEALFDAPLDEQPSWPALHDVLRDPKRNLLHDHLGLGEDDGGDKAIRIEPDCADLPYFLRAYFAFKLGLPFGWSSCTRGGPGGPPRCGKWYSQRELTSKPRRGGPAAAFGLFLRTRLADGVQSGNGRAPDGDDRTDYYPVPLREDTLRPGTVYADPYGHILVLARRVAQTKDAGGILLAVDGQPDGTIARRRFWRGNFLFATDPKLGSPGFKHFRPIVADGARLRPLTNDEIARAPDYGDFSLEQTALSVDAFYDRMDDVISPAPLDPSRAMMETIQALEEQVKGRVTSVDNGEKYKAKGGETVEMPEGATIFETTGPWEDFSTPSRDLRLLIAIDIVRHFPERVARRASRFAMPKGKSPDEVKAELEAILTRELAGRSIAYQRSDGSPWKLTLADVLERAKALEMAYNPNDCVEVRWGAPEGSDERKPCRARAPGDQRAQMAKMRRWFRDRQRPVRE